jgi:hypothetical protein
MAFVVSNFLLRPKLNKFNGIRRTPEGMLYLTDIDPNADKQEIVVSNYYEDGKSDDVARDETDYLDERLEMFEVQYFTGDGSAKDFTLTSPILNATRIAVFLDGVRQVAYSNYTLSGTTVSFVLIPPASASIVVGQIKRRYFNNDSDKYQQIKYSDDITTTFLINSISGDLVRRQKAASIRSAESSDDFDTFESTTASVSTTTYQSAV